MKLTLRELMGILGPLSGPYADAVVQLVGDDGEPIAVAEIRLVLEPDFAIRLCS